MAVKLTDYPSIEGSYGGQQLWWGKGSVGHHFGCGVIAALDGLIYRDLVTLPTLSKSAYLTYANELWQYIRPNTSFRFKQPGQAFTGPEGFGVYSARKLMKGLDQFLEKKHYTADYRKLSNRKSFWLQDKACSEAREYIKEAIANRCPVHLLSWKENQEGYNFHWITVTGIRSITPSLSQVTIATWGQEKIIENFESFWRADGLFDYKVMVTYDLQASS